MSGQAPEVAQISTISASHRMESEVVSLDHQIFSKKEWRQAKLEQHPRIQLQVAIHNSPATVANVECVADTGAMSNLWSFKEFLRAGFNECDLSPVAISMKAANKSPVRIDGAFLATLEGRCPN